jgi:4-amino-4-deoxy-L-arabinose transferase-like glycosyltransferase
MDVGHRNSRYDARVRRAWPFAVAVLAVIAINVAALGRNPPDFHFDESSVAYNAYTIAKEGRDEHGRSWPLFFEAFGEYKNPVYIYLLAGVFKIFGPGIVAARALSAILGVATALAVARLAWSVTRNRRIALAALLIAAVTPMLFEVSRLVLEAVVFPFAVALFLLAARAAHDREEWSPALVAALVATLALVTYSYTAGRFLAPIFALMLAMFVTRKRLRAYVAILVLYALTLVPAAIFNANHPGAFFQHSRDVAMGGPPAVFLENFILNFDPINLALVGDPNGRHHVSGSGGSILVMTFILVAIGAWTTRHSRWTQFLLLGMLAAMLPGAVAKGVANTLRLSGVIVFLLALGFHAISTRKLVLAAVFAQAAWFFYVFHRDGGYRPAMFDTGAQKTVHAAIAQPRRPIYLDAPLYVHAYWFAALEGFDRSQFRRLAEGERAPRGAVVWSDTFAPKSTVVLAKQGRFATYISP